MTLHCVGLRIPLENGPWADYLDLMADVYIPFAGDKPAALDINGHRLIILSTEEEWLQEGLDYLGGDRVERYSTFSSRAELHDATTKLAKSYDAGVVIAPADVQMADLIHNLQSELPWIQ
ncbi:MAG: hypothetical protein J5J00_10120 [Deltaproteobacteria bacterium]|nr:hypothetical protein [Deltaproteobacteria bacterium]